LNRLYQVAFVVGTTGFAVLIGLGVYQSLAAGEGLPPVSIDYAGETQRLLVDGDDYARTAERLRLAARLDYFSTRPRHWFELAKLSYRADDLETYREAIKGLRALTGSGATADPRMYYYLAVALMLRPDIDQTEMTEALGLAALAAQTEPDFGQAHLTLGQALAILATSSPGQVNLSELQQAESHLRRAVELEPANAEAARALANTRKLLQAVRGQAAP